MTFKKKTFVPSRKEKWTMMLAVSILMLTGSYYINKQFFTKDKQEDITTTVSDLTNKVKEMP